MKYIDREGNISVEDSDQDRLLRRLYGSWAGRMFLKVFVRPEISRAGGWLLNRRISKILIQPFIEKNKIDMSIYEKES